MASTDSATTTQDPISAVSTAELEAAAQRPPREERADRELFFNRELSWVQFNERVLELVEDDAVPLLERVKFASIYSSNLDEFFMIRVAGLHDQVDAGLTAPQADGRSAADTIEAIRERTRELGRRLTRCVDDELRPGLAEHGVRIVEIADLDDAQRAALEDRFHRQVFPVLTPLAVGLGRPFPYISNLSLSLAVLVRDPESDFHTFARVKVPTEMLPRFVEVPGGDGLTFITLEDLIACHLSELFPGTEIVEHAMFRVTRDADFDVSDEADDLVRAVENELRRRRFGEVVRVEMTRAMSEEMRVQLKAALEVGDHQLYNIDGLLDLQGLMQLVGLPDLSALRDEPWAPVTQPRLQESGVMPAMRQGDLLVHHPYDAFATSVERFVQEAAEDPDVLAIKQTVYRTSDDSPLVPALIRARENGKEAVCLVELKARFDERANIGWARRLEQAGVHVVYGHPALKTHAKAVLVIRREGDGVRHYVHVGTGNYHAKTARLYTDFGLFTCDEEIGADVAEMFNFLTGFGRPRGFREVLVAPTGLRDGIIAQIDRTIAAHEAGQHARIRLKMNSLVDGRCIRALYRASAAGVDVAINVRGICCLRPGVAGLSEGIRVVSIVGRFLEHSRIFAFEHGDETEVLIGSADLMPRNLDQRVELVAPVQDPALRDDLLDTLERCFADDTNAWELDGEGTWTRRTPDPSEPRSVQRELMLGHTARAVEEREPGD